MNEKQLHAAESAYDALWVFLSITEVLPVALALLVLIGVTFLATSSTLSLRRPRQVWPGPTLDPRAGERASLLEAHRAANLYLDTYGVNPPRPPEVLVFWTERTEGLNKAGQRVVTFTLLDGRMRTEFL